MKVLKNKELYNFLICFFYILFFIILSVTGNYRLYVKKFYFPYILIGILILFFLLIVITRRLKKFKEMTVYEVLSFIVFIFPLILVMIVKPSNLPIYTALKRGIQTEFLSENILKSLQETIEMEGKYKKLNIKQILALSKTRAAEINEKDIITEGIYFRDENEKNKFMLIRFLITCCAADATPLGIEVEFKEPEEDIKTEFKNDDWVKVKGKIKIEEGKVKMIAESVEKTNKPTDPYLY